MVDAATQRVQQSLSHALAAVFEMINAIGNDTAGSTDANHLITDAFTLLMQVRKEQFRNALGYPIGKLCTWGTPVGQELIFPELLPSYLKFE